MYEIAHASQGPQFLHLRVVTRSFFSNLLESAAKIRMQSNKTFGSALDMAKVQKLVNPEVAEVLRRIEVVRHNHLGHGGKTPFSLAPDEIDFVYVSCILGARLFLRLTLS
ncbi:hypothetical protein [Nannocystis pusilla]|uniref:hypothetical protein n=1 Tax=Nannocystis pusilla TaxID=889268 RepID=UPI003B7F6573